MARMPTPSNFGIISAKRRREWIESHSWSEGGLKSILAEEAEANKAQEEGRLWNRIKRFISKNIS